MFLAIFKVVFSGIKDFILWPIKFIFNLFETNPKVAIGLVIIIALSIGVWRAEVYVKGLNTQIKTAQNSAIEATSEKNRIQLDLRTAEQINKDNQLVIKQMKDDAELNKKRIVDLSKDVTTNNKKYSDLINKINNTPKEQDGPIAKVLADTIKEIQVKRDSK